MRHPRPLALLLLVLLAACGGEADIPGWALATAIPAEPAPAGASPAATAPGSALGPDVRTTTTTGTEVVVDVRPGDRSWSVAVRGATPDDLVGIRAVIDPTGTTRYRADLRRELLLVDELHPVVLADAGAVGLYVAPPEGEALLPGRWQVEVVGNAAPPTTAVAVRAGDPAEPQRLDLHVWATADVDPAAVEQAWRDQIDAVLTPHGIAVGDLVVTPAGEAGAGFALLGVDGLADEVHRACDTAATATGVPPRAGLVVLVDRIGEGVLTARGPEAPAPSRTAYRRPDGDVDGFAVATPGTPVLGPRSHGCVAVAAGEDATGRGLVALHEVLHQAGLTRHTTEQDGLAHDGLPDTPECQLGERDADGDLEVTAAECDGAGGDNLMFWAVGGSRLTPAQAWRVRAHPLLRPA